MKTTFRNCRTKTKLAFALICILALLLTGCQSSDERKYSQAQKLMSKGEYDAAAEIFQEIQGYEDANQFSMYAKALSYAERGEYDIALQALETLGDFRDSNQQKIYYEARSYADIGDYYSLSQAKETYGQIPLFRDVSERVQAIDEAIKAIYDAAIQSGESGNFMDAYEQLYAMSEYEDARLYADYYNARYQEELGDTEEALYVLYTYRNLNGFLDSRERFDAYADVVVNKLQKGDYVYFGNDSSLAWRVLSVINDGSEKKLMLITADIVGIIPYGETDELVTWENSYLREWMNNDFYWETFMNGEDMLIEESDVPVFTLVPGDVAFRCELQYGGVKTRDRLFALSFNDLLAAFDSDEDRVCESQEGWWLRDGGYCNNPVGASWYTAGLVYGGDAGSADYEMTENMGECGARPAMWVSLTWREPESQGGI